jgi:hypothetical protein
MITFTIFYILNSFKAHINEMLVKTIINKITNHEEKNLLNILAFIII